jgi:hypothetical protein
MHLWNDYEGTTLAGQWTLGQLLRTEGRSALFATKRADGGAAVLRLTEALNDQAVLQARYRAIQAAGDEFLVAVETYGDAELDGTPLSYAVLEPTQESLADILSQRSLAVDEAREVAQTVAGGLLGLHAQGLVHGLVEPESVLAAGERIKLRSDCARPPALPEDAMNEGAVTPRTDAFGLAAVIFQSLTRNRLQDASDSLQLPEPFATIVRNTARGAWGVQEIAAELERTKPRAMAAAPVTATASAPVAAAGAEALPVGAEPAGGMPLGREVKGPVARDAEGMAQPMLPLTEATSVEALSSLGRADASWQQPEPVQDGRRKGILIGVVAVVVVLLLFVIFHHSGSAPAGKTAVSQTAAPVAQSVAAAPDLNANAASAEAEGNAGAVAPGHAAPPSHRVNPAQAPVAAATQHAAPAARTLPPGTKVWRVIAFTYDRRDEAARKAASINARFHGMNAEVWSRTGNRPFLVTLGGELEKGPAFALRARARHLGVARDVYAQNYTE